MIEIVGYRETHFDAVAALWRKAFPDDKPWNAASIAMPEKLRAQRDLFLVALEADAVAGSIMAGYDGHRGWISRIAVGQSYRERGVGRLLIAEAEARLAALGCVKINLQVIPSNAGALRFYQRLGYVPEERVSLSKMLRHIPG